MWWDCKNFILYYIEITKSTSPAATVETGLLVGETASNLFSYINLLS